MSFVDIDADIKPWLGIEASNTKNDAVLAVIRDAVEKSVVEYCEQDFVLQVVVGEVLDGNRSDQIIPRHFPIVSVENIYIAANPDGTGGIKINSDMYQVLSEGITLRGINTTKGRGSIRIDYTHGYDGVPSDVKLAIIQAVEAEFRRKGRKSIGLTSRSKKDESEGYSTTGGSWDTKTGLPNEVVSKLNPYRTFEFPIQPIATRNH